MGNTRLSQNLSIFMVSVLILFLEILAIRWLATEVRIFAYLHNMVLITVFLGIGCGCYSASRRIFPLVSAITLAALVLAVQDPLDLGWLPFKSVTTYLASLSQMDYWYLSRQALSWAEIMKGFLLLLASLLFIALVFFPLGQVMGRLMQDHPNPIESYSVNILGSLAGVWLFNGLSSAWAPPWVWFGAALVLFVPVLPGWRQRAVGALILLIPVLTTFHARPEGLETVWSPYQKLTLTPATIPDSNFQFGHYLRVNGVWFQAMVNLSESWTRTHAQLQDHSDRTRPPVFAYDPAKVNSAVVSLAYRLKAPRLDNVLIVGSGSGHDVAAALRAGAKHVVAVEIDPAVVDFGRRYHPESPFADPRVTVVVDDARAYLKRARTHFDVIRFGFLDSHTQASGFNNLRLDNYVYTLEAFQEARNLLEPDGVVAFSFAMEKPWMGQRFTELLTQAFGNPPLCFYQPESRPYLGSGGHVFLAGDAAVLNQLGEKAAADPDMRANLQIQTRPFTSGTVVPTTDDWPYLYLEKPGVPAEYVAISVALILIVVILRYTLFPRGTGIGWHFFFLGAAFLLLEVHGISRAMLLFGTTWVVNSYVISTVLILIFLSNVAERWIPQRSMGWVYAGLLLSVLLNFAPVSAFGVLAPTTRTVTMSLFLCLPVFFAGSIFIKSFARTAHRDMALGSNLLGAICGGLLESLSYAWGMHSITVLVLVLYILALLTVRTAGGAAEAGA